MLSIGKSGGLLALTGVMSLLMITMGVWQLSRADEKRLLLQEWQQRRDIGLALHEALVMSSPYGYRLEANGVYLSGGDLFLDNQIASGRAGYRLIRPLQTRHGLLAVDTGWWPADPDRRKLPPIPPQHEPVQLSGHIIRPYVPPLSLGEVPFDPRLRRVSSLETEQLAQIWGQQVLPFVLKLGIEQGDWQPVVMGPERHIGYAVQWFAMTLAIWGAAAWWYRRQHEA
ncbi:SURF1 family protein [uncultured Oceanisphaera sp.]|uniref:SURF1 family protein n=1 Tax=uncultured Oceanisphaera sp. TaxID=353858 RepID=UPI00262BFF77|nr:SURF1 family protein [uncultured Oceanisphaera sp.]